jgi:hypothetical protein
MRIFTRSEIDEWREKFVQRKYSLLEANLVGRKINYFVIPRKLFNGIPNGLFRMTGHPSDGYLVGVSDEVPVVVRPHFAFSEYDEFMIYGMNDLDRTLHSEQNMVRIVEKECPHLKGSYVIGKLSLYEHILRNSQGKLDEWGFNPQDYQGFEKAYLFLLKA